MTKPDSDSRMLLPILLLFSLNMSVCVSKLQVAIIARSSRDMSQTVLKKLYLTNPYYLTHTGINFDIQINWRIQKFSVQAETLVIVFRIVRAFQKYIWLQCSATFEQTGFFLGIPTLTNSFYHRIYVIANIQAFTN